MATVFISYAREDLEFARSLYAFVLEGGHKVWMDKESLLPGEDWKQVIHKAIRESDFFLACLSKKSVSKRGYVQRELKQACEVLDEFPEGEIFIVPIRLDDCEPPQRFEDLHCIDWIDENSKRLLRKTLSSKGKQDESAEQFRLLNLLARLRSRTRYLYPELHKSAAASQTRSEPVSLLESTLESVMPVLEELKANGLLEYSYADDDAKVIDGRSGELVRRVQLVSLDLNKLRPLLMALEEHAIGDRE
ncbi:MAG TPA: toll/interleukin-1 receptor domain-containing protein [Thermoanaerobaculia bacterium]|nr:toll/interleukin-1 receptor domain-containing protein [Thermoanaerobaculia bacterium]